MKVQNMRRRYVELKNEEPSLDELKRDARYFIKQSILQAVKELFPAIPKESADRVKLVHLRTVFRQVGLSTKMGYMAKFGCDLFGISPEENKMATCVLIANFLFDWITPPRESIQKGIALEKKRERERQSAKGKIDFYQTWAWKSLRYQALKKYGARCMVCGATPESGAVICVDHIKPRSKFPELSLDINNLQVLCTDCNMGKSNWDETDWRNK